MTNNFEVSLGSDYKLNPSGTFFVIEYTPVQLRLTNDAGTAYAGCPVAPTATDGGGTGWSIPWNTLHFINQIQLSIGGSKRLIEDYPGS